MIPPGGAIVEVFSFKVLSAQPSSITIVPSRTHTYPDGFVITERTAVFRGKGPAPAGTFYGFNQDPDFGSGGPYDWDYPIDYVSLDIVPDGSQAPPPTAEEKFVENVFKAISDWSDSVGNPHPINSMAFTIVGHFSQYIGETT